MVDPGSPGNGQMPADVRRGDGPCTMHNLHPQLARLMHRAIITSNSADGAPNAAHNFSLSFRFAFAASSRDRWPRGN
jgi:hypothetical protein